MAEEDHQSPLAGGLEMSSFTMGTNEDFKDSGTVNGTDSVENNQPSLRLETIESVVSKIDDLNKSSLLESSASLSVVKELSALEEDAEELGPFEHELNQSKDTDVEEVLTFTGNELTSNEAPAADNDGDGGNDDGDFEPENATLQDESDDGEEPLLATPKRVLKKRLLDLECLQCDQTFISAALLRRHRKMHSRQGKKKKKSKGMRFTSAPPAIDVNCEKCGKHFKRKDHYKRHMLTHERQKVREEAKALLAAGDSEGAAKLLETSGLKSSPSSHRIVDVSCPECGRHFKRTDHLKRHGETHARQKARQEAAARAGSDVEGSTPSAKTSRTKKRAGKTSARTLVDAFCKVCGRYFNRLDHLRRHEAVHMVDRPFKCHLCPMSFTRQERLKRHVHKHDFQCDQCNKCFTKAELLEKHKLSHLFKCEFCHQRFNTKDQLKAHLPIHEHEMPNICDICGKCFHFKKQLHNHREVHKVDSPNYTPFTCEVCGQLCKTKKLLYRHQVGHTGRRDFMCQVCGKSFKVRVDLTKHNIIHFGSRKHKCAVCDKGFYQNKDLKRHMQVHGDETPFRCEICNKGFKVRYNYNMHLFTHSGKHPFECKLCLQHFRSGIKLKTHLLETHPEAKALIDQMSDNRIDTKVKALVPQRDQQRSDVNHVTKSMQMPSDIDSMRRHVNESPAAAMGMEDSSQSMQYQHDAMYNQQLLTRMLDPDHNPAYAAQALFGNTLANQPGFIPNHNTLGYDMYGENDYKGTMGATQMSNGMVQEDTKVLTEREQESVVYSQMLWDWSNYKESQEKYKQTDHHSNQENSKLNIIDSISHAHEDSFDWDDTFDTTTTSITTSITTTPNIKQENTAYDEYASSSVQPTLSRKKRKLNSTPDDDGLEIVTLVLTKDSPSNNKCPICERVLSRVDHLKSHVRRVHSKRLIIEREEKLEDLPKISESDRSCNICQRQFRRADHLRRHLRRVHKQQIPVHRRKQTTPDTHEIKDVMENDFFVLMSVDLNETGSSITDFESANTTKNESVLSDHGFNGEAENVEEPMLSAKLELISDVDEADDNDVMDESESERQEMHEKITDAETEPKGEQPEGENSTVSAAVTDDNLATASELVQLSEGHLDKTSGGASGDGKPVIKEDNSSPSSYAASAFMPQSPVRVIETRSSAKGTPTVKRESNEEEMPPLLELYPGLYSPDNSDSETAAHLENTNTSESYMPSDADDNATTEAATDGEVVTEAATDDEDVTESVADGEGVTESVADGEGVTESVVDGEGVTESVADGDGVTESVADGGVVSESSADSDSVMEAVAAGEGGIEAVADGDGMEEAATGGEGVTESVADGEGVTESVADGEGVKESVADGEVVTESVADGDGVMEAVADGEGLTESVADGEGMEEAATDGEGVTESVADGEGVTESVADGEGVTQVITETKMEVMSDAAEEEEARSEYGNEASFGKDESGSENEEMFGKEEQGFNDELNSFEKEDQLSDNESEAIDDDCDVDDPDNDYTGATDTEEPKLNQCKTETGNTRGKMENMPNSASQNLSIVDKKVCPICGKKYARSDHMKRHVKLVHKLKLPNEKKTIEVKLKPMILKVKGEGRPRVIKCPVCNKELTRMRALLYHCERVHYLAITVENSSNSSTTPTKQTSPAAAVAVKSTPSQEKTHACIVCNKIFKRKDHLNRHILVHSGTKPFQCDRCSMAFTRKEYLDNHLQTHSPKCEICNMEFDGKVEYKQHLIEFHENDKPNICEQCGRRFLLKMQLKNHIKTHNPVESSKTYTCEICGQIFRAKRLLERHHVGHTGRRDFVCPICGKAFKMKVDLYKHSVYHSEKKNYQCPKCPLAFFQSKDLRRHLFNHSDIKPYKCDVCERAFKNKQNLKVHAYTHTGTKPHQCRLCLLSFRSGVKLETHMASSHPGHNVPEVEGGHVMQAALEQVSPQPSRLEVKAEISAHDSLQSMPVSSNTHARIPQQQQRQQHQTFDQSTARILQTIGSPSVTSAMMTQPQQAAMPTQMQYDNNQPLQLTSEGNPRYMTPSAAMGQNQSQCMPMLSAIESITPVASPQPSAYHGESMAISAHELMQRALSNPAQLDALHRALNMRDVAVAAAANTSQRGMDYPIQQAHTSHRHPLHAHTAQRALANPSPFDSTLHRNDQSRAMATAVSSHPLSRSGADQSTNHAASFNMTAAQYQDSFLSQEQARWIYNGSLMENAHGFQPK